MTNNECLNCMYSIDGVCRLENTNALEQAECPNKEGSLSTFSIC